MEDNKVIKYKLKDVVNFYGGKSIYSKKYINKHQGIYPVYSAATKNKGVIGYIDSYDFDGEYGTYTTRGNAGSLFYRNGKFNLINLFAFNSKDNNKFSFLYIYIYAMFFKIYTKVLHYKKCNT